MEKKTANISLFFGCINYIFFLNNEGKKKILELMG